MEEDVKAGLDLFKSECEKRLPGISLVVPTRPTGANFLISFTFKGMRTYSTIHEDDFAEWGETKKMPETMEQVFKDILQSLYLKL